MKFIEYAQIGLLLAFANFTYPLLFASSGGFASATERTYFQLFALALAWCWGRFLLKNGATA